MTEIEIRDALRAIGEALHSTNHCITTDDPDAQPTDGYSWRIDNGKAITLTHQLEHALLNMSNFPESAPGNSHLWTWKPETP